MRKVRVEVLHGVNFDVLEKREAAIYGGTPLRELEQTIQGFGREFELDLSFTQTNHEGAYCEALHRAMDLADGLVLNPGAWTHYSYAIRDAIELTRLPAVEVHLSNIEGREEWRRTSVIRDVCIGHVQGKGVDGYREALAMLKERMSE
jgi:3-dehydroquinate dehydratase II